MIFERDGIVGILNRLAGLALRLIRRRTQGQES
jgi:hypothetical protein